MDEGQPANGRDPTMLHLISKLGWWLLAPANLLLIALFIGLSLLWTRWWRAGRIVVTGVGVTGALITVLPIGDWAAGLLENRFPAMRALPADVTGIITLGGVIAPYLTAERGRPALNGGVERLTEFVALARHYPTARLVFTGGTGSILHPELSEAPVARRVLELLGLDPARVTFEEQSRNTFENARLTRKLVAPKPGDRWILITSALHMPRSVGTFRAAGWDVIPYPVDYLTVRNPGFGLRFSFRRGLNVLTVAMKEWIGLCVYRLLSRTQELFPGPAPHP